MILVLTEIPKTMMRQPPKTRIKFYYVQFIEAVVVLLCTKQTTTGLKYNGEKC